jgi:uncharacterized RDD family membrane protein YckC
MSVTGHYAGPVSRAAAAAADIGVVVGSYTVAVAAASLLVETFLRRSLAGDRYGPVALTILAVWAFAYVFVSLLVAGRTLGKGLVGVRVVQRDGSVLTARAAFWRTVVFPFSGLLLGLGYLPILLHREHRALHDLVAGTAVVYDWGVRDAQLPGPLTEYLRTHDADADRPSAG